MLGGLALVTRRQWKGHKLRTLLTVFGIAIGVATYFAVQASTHTIFRAFEKTTEKIAGKAEIQVFAGETGFDEKYLAAVRDTQGVAVAEPALEMIGKTESGESLLLIGLDTTSDLELHSEIVPEQLVSIDDPLKFINEPDSIAVSREFAERKGLAENSVLKLRTQSGTKEFTVRGFFKPVGVGELFGGNVAVMDLYSMQGVFGREGLIDRIDLKTDDSASVEDTIGQLREKLPAGIETSRPEQRGKAMATALAGVETGLGLMSFLALAISLFIVFNSFYVSVSQRWKEIGVLRALGVPRFGVQAMFLGEAALLGLLGSIIGVVLGYFLAIGAIRTLSAVSAASYGLVTTADLPSLDPWNAVLAILIGTAASVFGALLPARRAAIADPAAALRNIEARGRGKELNPLRIAAGVLSVSGGLAFTLFATPAVGTFVQVGYWMAILLGMVLLLPVFVYASARLLRPLMNRLFGAEGMLAVEAMARAPKRTTATVGALMIGLSFVISNGALIDSQKAALSRSLNRSVNADYFVTNSDQIRSRTYHFSEDLADRVASVEGVARAENLRVTSLKYGGREVALLAHDMDGWLTRSPDALDQGDARAVRERMSAGEGFLVSENFALRFGVALGDRITLESPGGDVTREVLGVLEYYQSEVGTVFLDRKLYKEYWGDDTLDYILITAAEGADRRALKAGIEEAVAGEQQVFVYSHEEYRNWVMGLIDQFFGLNYVQMVIAIMIGGLSLINTMVISVSERKQELSILRALGGFRSQVGKMIVLESIAISFVGILTGFVAGLLNAYCTLNISVVAVAGFRLPFRFPFTLLLAAIPLVVAVAAISAWYPARKAARLNVAEGLVHE
ncbi:MAG: ABC transporter permease [Aridibacter famidurans]|nr:ABC transporter permease [Aridibacter famidurans]